MNYENARKGIEKIYVYEVIQVIVQLLALLIAVLGLNIVKDGLELDADAGTVGAGLVILLATIAMLVLLIVGIVILLKGLNLASKDEPSNFKNAFYSAIIVLITSILSGLSEYISFLGSIKNGLDATTNCCQAIMFLCIVLGIRTIAENLGRKDIISLSVPVIGIEITVLIINAVTHFFDNNILTIVTAVLSLICYIIYLIYLYKAKKMFN